MAPVLDYLTCCYSSSDSNNKDGERAATEVELLRVYRRVMDGNGAAPGP